MDVAGACEWLRHASEDARCRQAQAAQFAAVWLWRIADWTPAGQPLEAHSLTVTQMAFSSNGQHLLTVSRDRTFAVWERQTAGKTTCIGFCPSPCSGSPAMCCFRLRAIH